MSDIGNCAVWPEFEADRQYRDPVYYIDSRRMGGQYKANPNTWHVYVGILDERLKARLTTLIIDQRNQGIEWPEITQELINTAHRINDLPASTRAKRLLGFISQKMDHIGSIIRVEKTVSFYPEILAWSESIVWDEVEYLVEYLMQQHWIIRAPMTFAEHQDLQITVEGYDQLFEAPLKLDSTQCFVAMWFDEETNEAYEKAIAPAIKASGYISLRIDKKEHINKIDDEIVAEIRRSLFLIADFTHGEKGIRGGVYYEAGFAHGLNLPVICSCRDDKMKDLHFDTRQINHIEWKSNALDEFRQNLENRILAIIGEGPNIPT